MPGSGRRLGASYAEFPLVARAAAADYRALPRPIATPKLGHARRSGRAFHGKLSTNTTLVMLAGLSNAASAPLLPPAEEGIIAGLIIDYFYGHGDAVARR